jgi:predicted MPP superfamily phosphohydrolase
MLIDAPVRPAAAMGSKAKWMAGAALLAGTAGAAAIGYSLLVEPMQISLERRTIRLGQARGRLPARGLRILQVSDSHFMGRNWRERQKIERVARLVQGLECDLLIHTGDFVHYDSGLENVHALLDVLPKPRLGSFGVFGNHDYIHYNMGEALPRMWRSFRAQDEARRARSGLLARGWLAATRWPRYIWYVRNTPLDGRPVGQNDTAQLAAALRGHDMRLLHNEALHLYRPEEQLDIYLAGVDDVTQGRPHLGNTLDTIPQDAPVILLSHNPDIIGSPRIGQVDLVLSGHTHGGQLVLPLWGPAHTQSEHLAREHVAGYFQHGSTHFYISRGMGEGIPLRFFAPPQIALITVVAE